MKCEHKKLTEARREQYIERIISLMRFGNDKCIHASELAEAIGVNLQTAKAYIHEIRLRGWCTTPQGREGYILSGNKGYYLSDDPEEIQKYVNRHMKAGRTRFYTMKEINSLLRIDPDQMELELDALEDGDAILNDLKGENVDVRYRNSREQSE